MPYVIAPKDTAGGVPHIFSTHRIPPANNE